MHTTNTPTDYSERACPRLVYIVTHPMSARLLLRGQLSFMQERGFEVILITSPGHDLRAVEEHENVRVIPLPIPREIDPLNDLVALWNLQRVLSALKPSIVNAGTTKAGLLGMMAAWMAGVPIRVYVLRGLRLETARGASRFLLSGAEWIASRCATRILAVSKSLCTKYVSLGYAPEEKVTVLHEGSSNGIDIDRFAPISRDALVGYRARLGLPDTVPVVGFVGRFTRDKGIVELVDAFEFMSDHFPESRLLLIGDFEEGDPVPPAYVQKIKTHPRILLTGFVSDVSPYYQLMDVLAFPSHREGFPNAPLEAAASGIPTVGARATGTVDAVVDGVTGTVVPVGDAEKLARGLSDYLHVSSKRREHGEAAKERVANAYRSRYVWCSLYEEYSRLLSTKGIASPKSLEHTTSLIPPPGTTTNRLEAKA